MNLPTSGKKSYIFVLLVSIIAGMLLYWGYLNYSDTVVDWYEDLGKTEEVLTEKDAPYFGSVDRNLYIGLDAEWEFRVFQPKVVEYQREEGLYYMLVEYVPEDVDEKQQVRVLLTQDLDWFTSEESVLALTEDDLAELAPASIRNTYSYDWSDIDDSVDNEEFLRPEKFIEKFPVGSRVAMRVLVSYPSLEERTDEYCEVFASDGDLVCNYGKMADIVSVGLDDFNAGEEMGSTFALVAYSISEDLDLVGGE